MVKRQSKITILCLVLLLVLVLISGILVFASRSHAIQMANSSGWTKDCDGYGTPVYTWYGVPGGLQVCAGTGRSAETFGPNPTGNFDEFQCAELVGRYMWMAFNFPSLENADGAHIVDAYSNAYPGKLHRFYNDNRVKIMKIAPVPGDVISFTYVHTAIVINSTVDSSGSGDLTLIEQNYPLGSASFKRTIHVAQWIIDASANVKDWMTPRSSPAYPGGWWIGPTPTNLQTVTAGINIQLGFQANDNNNGGLKNIDFTESTDDGKTWTFLPNDNNKTKTVSGGDVQFFSHFSMPKSPVILSADVYSNNGNYQLAPNGLRYLCLSDGSCPTQLSVYNGPNIGGGTQTGCQPNYDQAAFFTAESYQGQCVTLDLGDYSSPDNIGLPNDSIESIMVGNNVKVTAYQDSGFNGLSETFLSSADTLRTHSINVNTISSLKIFPRGQIRICNGTNYSGVCTQFDEGIHNLDNTGTDECVKSIDFGNYGGLYHVVLWSGNVKPIGNPAHFDNSNANLNYCGDTRIRTVEVYRNLPPTASQQSPANNASFPIGTQNLDLTYDGGNEFQIHVWGSGYDVWQPWTTQKTLHLTGLTPGSYSWQVQGQNNLGTGPWSGTWTFTIATPPTPTTIPTQPPASTLITVSVLLDGIGIAGDATNPNSAGNMNPLHPNRPATVFVYNGTSLIATKYITISYVNGAFSGAVEVTGTVTGVTIATPGFLVSPVAKVTTGQNNQITLRERNGDVNRDGIRSSADYDAITACYGSNVASCQYGYNADINDDGVVDGTDINLWLREA